MCFPNVGSFSLVSILSSECVVSDKEEYFFLVRQHRSKCDPIPLFLLNGRRFGLEVLDVRVKEILL